MFARKGVPGVTWQDELQKLDNELASGRISADDYRRRRDEILSGSAGGAPAQSPQQAPFAPPFKWEAKPPSASNSDATQVVPNQMPPQQQPQQNHNPDATQVVNTQNRSSDAERTQFVAPVAPQQGWGPGPQQQQQAVAPPPWIGGDFDAINQPSPGWSHGPEVFDESGGGGGKGKIIGIVLAVVLLAGLGFGAYWLWGRGGADPNAGGQPTSPSSTTSSAPADPLQVGQIAGNPQERKDITTFEQISGLNPPYLTPGEVNAYKTASSAKSKLVLATPAKGVSTTVMIVTASEAAAANNCAIELKEVQVTNGMTEVTSDVPAKTYVTQVDAKDGQPARIRGHYSSKKYVVRIDVTAPTLAEAMQQFKAAAEAQLKAMPADA